MSNNWMSSQTKKEIGLADVLDKLALICPYGLSKKNHLQPFSCGDIEGLNEELEAVSSLKSFIGHSPQACNALIRLLKEMKDIRGSLERTRRDEILNEVELFEIKNQLMVMAEIRLLLSREKLNVAKIQLTDIAGIIRL